MKKLKQATHDERGRELFQTAKGQCWLFPILPEVGKKLGKATAIAALCLFAFTAPAQTGKVLHVAPGQIVFVFGRDTADTNALPAFYRLFGADSSAAIVRSAVSMGYLERGVERMDLHIKGELGGIGVREYLWLRGFLMHCDDVREDFNENRNRK